MPGIDFVLDPVSEDSSNTELELNDGTNFVVIGEPDFSPPDLETQWASSSDTEGALPAAARHQNRKITIPVRAYGMTASGLDSKIAQLQQKAGKITRVGATRGGGTRVGGTLKLVMPSSKTVVFDLLDASVATPIKRRLITNFIAETTLTFTALPYGRGSAVQRSLWSETSLPALEFIESGIGGDVPALGKLEVTDAQGADQWWLLYGMGVLDSFGAQPTNAAFYQAEALTPQGGASTFTASGASGTSVGHTNLGTAYLSILSTKLSGGSHLSHVGNYRVFARVAAGSTNNGDVTVCLEWSQGDLRAPTRNDPRTITQEQADPWWLLDLGTVSLDRAPRGTQQWEGRVLAKAQLGGDDVFVDYLLFVPLDASGEARAVPPTATPTSFNARDEFNQAAGALDGKVAPVGGTWGGAGSANDFSVVTATRTADRTAVSDGAAGRRVHLTNGALTDLFAQVDFMASSMPSGQLWTPGVFVREDTTSGRHLRVSVQSFNGAVFYDFYTNDSLTSAGLIVGEVPPLSAGIWYTLRVLVDYTGRLFVWFGLQGQTLTLALAAHESRLASGGSWASGTGYGFFDHKTDANAQTRSFDNFWAAPAHRDAAVFASQSAEIRHDGVIREDGAGAIWSPVSRFEGDYLRIPPGDVRFLVKASRNDPELMPDPSIDDIQARLTVTPRYLELPE